MTCSCCRQLSPFHFADFPRPSIFLQDKVMTKAAHTGLTISHMRSAWATKYEQETGRSAGSIHGISDKASLRVEESNYQRAKRKEAA